MKNAEKDPGSMSPVKAVAILTLSFLLSISTCVLFVLSTTERLSDEDYVYNFLKCTSESDSTAIPIAGSFVVACFFCAAHIIFYSIFGISAFSGKRFRRMHFRFYFSKSDSWPANLVKAVFCLPALFFIYDYARSYYKFYTYEFAFTAAIVLCFLLYGMIIAAFINLKKINPKFAA